MEDLKDDIKGKLELLFHTYDFEELMPEQQSWVKQYISTVDYQRYRNSILAAKSVFEQPLVEKNIPISPKVKNRLVAQGSKSASLWNDLVQMQVKVWQVAAGFLLLLGTGALTWLQHLNTSTGAMNAQVIYKTDTVYKAVPVVLSSNEPQIKSNQQIHNATLHKPTASFTPSTILKDTVDYVKQELSQFPETWHAQLRNWTMPYMPVVRYLSDTIQHLESPTSFMMKESLGTAIKDDKAYLELIRKIY